MPRGAALGPLGPGAAHGVAVSHGEPQLLERAWDANGVPRALPRLRMSDLAPYLAYPPASYGRGLEQQA